MKILRPAVLCTTTLIIVSGFLTGCNIINDLTRMTDWDELGGINKSPFISPIYSLDVDVQGNVYVGGGNTTGDISIWNGAEWTTLGDVSASDFTGGVDMPITVDKSGNVYAVGKILIPNANPELHIARWLKSSSKWENLTVPGEPLFDHKIYSVSVDANGNVYVAGNSKGTPGQGNRIVKWNGSCWTPLGTSLPDGDSIKLCVAPAGDVYAALEKADSASTEYVAGWNGTEWHELGSSDGRGYDSGHINSITTDTSGNVYIAGYFIKDGVTNNVAKWNKNTDTWSFLYGMAMPYDVYTTQVDSKGKLYAAGAFMNSEGERYIAKWDGGTWSSVGNLLPNAPVHALCVSPEGRVYMAGDFTDGNNRYFVAVFLDD